MIDTLKWLFKRDLEKLKTELQQYQSEAHIWIVEKSISNSAGNLCLHLVGNLNAFIGVGLAQTSYVRQRDLEFSSTNIPLSTLLQLIDDTIVVVEKGLSNVTQEQLSGDFPIVIWDKPTGMEHTLILLATHLNYHLGQINYHRRLLD